MSRQSQKHTIVNAILVFVILIVILQLWLLTATVNATLGGDTSVVLPAAVVSVVCLALNGGLLRYLFGLEARRPRGDGPTGDSRARPGG